MPAPTPRDSASEPFIAATAQTLIAGAVAACLAAAVAWLTLAGGFSGRLVDHESPPAATARFTVNVNAASAVELAQLPGLGPAMAQRIVDHRAAHGDFPSLDALLDVPGVGEATLAAIKPHLRPIKQFPAPPGPAEAE
jgi:competence protein ComEA